MSKVLLADGSPDPFHPDNLRIDFEQFEREKRRRAQVFRLAGRMSEAEFSEKVRDLCQLLNLLHYHTYDSRGSQPGYPDWHIVGPERSIFRELKTERGELSQHQRDWFDALARAGHDIAVWRPRDLLLNNTIKSELKALSATTVR